MENNEEEFYVWDGINCTLEEVDSIEDAKTFIKENFIEEGEIHPDIESVFILKKVASVYVEDTGKKSELNGDLLNMCKVVIE